MKFATTFVICAIFIAISAEGGKPSTDYSWGKIGPNDVLLAKKNITHLPIIGLWVHEKYVFGQKGNLNAKTITAITATDQKKKGNGADVLLKYGGPGSKGATLKFDSQRGHGINHLVEIWGRE